MASPTVSPPSTRKRPYDDSNEEPSQKSQRISAAAARSLPSLPMPDQRGFSGVFTARTESPSLYPPISAAASSSSSPFHLQSRSNWQISSTSNSSAEPNYQILFPPRKKPNEPTPIYKYKRSQFIPSLPPVFKKAIELYEFYRKNHFLLIDVQGQSVRVVNLRSGGGQHHVIGDIEGHPQWIFKMASDHSILVINSPDTLLRSDYLKNVLDQYEQMRKADIPQAEIINYDAMKNVGCPYFVVERISDSLFKGDQLPANLTVNDPILNQIRILFEKAYNHHIHVDLQISNLHKKNGIATFIDWREDRPDEYEFETEIKIDFKKMLRMIDPTYGEIYQFLSQKLDLNTPWATSVL